MQEFDLVVIGSGPAGYTGAIRAAQLGMKVACVEKYENLGGTCLNVGCIPSKSLLDYSQKYDDALNNFKDIGIGIDSLSLDVGVMIQKKSKVVSTLCKGIAGLFAKNKIKRFVGTATLKSNNVVKISGNDVSDLKTKYIMIATGSKVLDIPNVKVDEKRIISSVGALDIKKVPESLLVIGGGYIGLELGSVWRRLGAKVKVVEFASSIVPMMDKEIGNHLYKALISQGMEFNFNTKVLSSEIKENKVITKVSSLGKESVIESETVLVSVGRKPYTEGLGLENIGIKKNERGQILVDSKYKTSLENIYAVGDVIAGPMLAHKAEEEAIAAVENIAGKYGHVNYKTIPSVIYTSPEVASVGATEEELKSSGIEYKVGKFPFAANGKAISTNHTYGLVKILADKKTDAVLGGHIIGHEAGNMISEITTIMEFGGSSEDIAITCHPHPTLSEAVKEAALDVHKRAINF